MSIEFLHKEISRLIDVEPFRASNGFETEKKNFEPADFCRASVVYSNYFDFPNSTLIMLLLSMIRSDIHDVKRLRAAYFPDYKGKLCLVWRVEPSFVERDGFIKAYVSYRIQPKNPL
jgi:hypothetical protein